MGEANVRKQGSPTESAAVGTVDLLKAQKTILLSLSVIQAEMRKAVETERKDKKLTVGTMATNLGTTWVQLNNFLQGKSSVGSGRILKGISDYFKKPEWAEKVGELARELNMPKRQILAAFEAEVIELYFKLERAHQKVVEKVSRQVFASVFGDHSNVVFGMLQINVEGIILAKDPGTRKGILDILNSEEWPTLLTAAISGHQADVDSRATELRGLLERMKPNHPEIKDQAVALSVSASTLWHALGGRASVEYIDTVIKKAKELLDGASPTVAGQEAAVETPSGPVPAAPESAETPAQNEEDLPSAITALGGETSPLGVDFVLGPDSFRQIDVKSGKELVVLLTRFVRTSRLLMNVCSQIKDPAVREEIRAKLGKELEELHLAMQLFTQEFPNRLVELFQAQRETWAFGQARPKGKKGRS